ncbi:hypothetical protein CISG_09317 [Coccidioides immitis RMSCC 3703]|uniref:Uncharacterized protein n=1 Tax=Coccidioides immitis RMSCC 3703 TaxID=454286 RepID=A0A0J8RB23_COCIT|nr:hypothetical protein CISG_09317 [Coccidioides immitis RMSCC 3703]
MYYPKPENILKQSMTLSKSSFCSRKQHAGSLSLKSRDTTNTRSSTLYSQNFQQNLTNHGIYPPEYRFPNGEKTQWLNNWNEIKRRLGNLQPSLSPSRFSEKELEEFKEADAYTSKKKPVTTTVIPIIEGDISNLKCSGGEYLFGNLAPLTDGMLAQAKPDHFYSAHPEQLNHQIHNDLSNQIILLTQDDLPMESDASSVSNETEYQDAQWSFAAPIEGGEDEFQSLGRNPKKQRMPELNVNQTKQSRGGIGRLKDKLLVL